MIRLVFECNQCHKQENAASKQAEYAEMWDAAETAIVAPKPWLSLVTPGFEKEDNIDWKTKVQLAKHFCSDECAIAWMNRPSEVLLPPDPKSL